MILLEFKDVFKKYSEEAPAIQSLSFTIRAGEFTALAGPSGSGKTTVLNLAAGLDSVTHGKVTLLGRKLNELKQDELCTLRREHLGFIFQSYNLLPVLTAIENVEYPLALGKIPKALRKIKALSMLAQVGLEAFANRFPSQLSGGQQQRVAIARAMVTNPEIVFADEPTANLDSKSAESLLSLFKALNEKTKTTFLFSSHDPMVLKTAKRTLHLIDGRIISDSQERTSPYLNHSSALEFISPLWVRGQNQLGI